MVKDRKRFNKIKKLVFKYAKADDIQINYMSENSFLTRLANSYIHQNVHEKNETLIIKLAIGKKLGVASTNNPTEKNIKKTVSQARKIARLNPEDPDYPGLPDGVQIDYDNRFVEATHKITPKQKAEILKRVVGKCSDSGVNASGFLKSGTHFMAVATDKGADCACIYTDSHLFIITDQGMATGFAEDRNIDISKLDWESVADVAIEKCLLSRNPISIKPGEYTVILEEPAVSEMLAYFSWIAFNAKSYHENRGALSGMMGKKVMGKNITIIDNWRNRNGRGLPFDSNGVKRKKIDLIKDGVFVNMVHNYYLAKKYNQRNTGHALPPQASHGALPLNMVLKPGNSNLEKMIKSTKKGILVTRFHYTNIVDPIRTIYTGMTRNGTFLIKNGKIESGIKNLRFTQSILKAFSNVMAISKQGKFSGGFMGGGSITPALKIKKFNFTGTTEF